MIVVDSNVLVYLYLPTERTAQAEQLRMLEPHWVAPRLWRSEVRSALSLYIRQRHITLEQALQIQTAAEHLLADAEFDVPSFDVLQLASNSTCSAYDCEFVALAQGLGIELVTADKKVLREFPDTAIALASVGT